MAAHMKHVFGLLEHQGRRDGMEDASSVLLADNYSLFGVYDGHGGDTCSTFLKEKLLSRVSTYLNNGESPEQALEKAFEGIDKEYCDFALKMEVSQDRLRLNTFCEF